MSAEMRRKELAVLLFDNITSQDDRVIRKNSCSCLGGLALSMKGDELNELLERSVIPVFRENAFHFDIQRFPKNFFITSAVN